MPLRFVVLHHTGIPEPHYDFMIESTPGGPLYTWRCGEIPTARGVTSGRRQMNHRQLYMEYEGEISGGRGTVQRVVAGRCQFRKVSKGLWLFVPEIAKYASYFIAPTGLIKRLWIIEARGAEMQPSLTDPV